MFGVRYVTKSDLLVWKQEYKYHKIIYIDFHGRQYVFRSLTKKEYNDISNIVSDEYTVEDLVCQTAMLYPDNEVYNIAKCGHAGLPKFASEIILNNSIISSTRELEYQLDVKRGELNTINNQIMIIIKTAFPEYTIEDIENMTWEETVEKIAMAECIINTKDANRNLRFNLAQVEEKKTSEAERKRADKELLKSLREEGIDPVNYFNTQVNISEDLIQFPFIGGRHWNNEVVVDAIRRQIHKCQSKQK